MNNKGYIYYWRTNRTIGKLFACIGQYAGTAFAFSIDDCDSSLQTKLKQKNEQRNMDCPPPNGALCVTYSFGIDTDGEYVAINISEANC
jgi:hypothetical protein